MLGRGAKVKKSLLLVFLLLVLLVALSFLVVNTNFFSGSFVDEFVDLSNSTKTRINFNVLELDRGVVEGQNLVLQRRGSGLVLLNPGFYEASFFTSQCLDFKLVYTLRTDDGDVYTYDVLREGLRPDGVGDLVVVGLNLEDRRTAIVREKVYTTSVRVGDDFFDSNNLTGSFVFRVTEADEVFFLFDSKCAEATVRFELFEVTP